jgi:hypothetical protein
LDFSLPDLVRESPAQVSALDTLAKIQGAFAAMQNGPTAKDRFLAGRAVVSLIAEYQRTQTLPAIRETLANLRARFIPDLVGVRFKAYVWNNDDDTTSDRTEVKYGLTMAENDNSLNTWTEWFEIHDVWREYPELTGSREFFAAEDDLEEMALWNLDSAGSTLEVLLEKAPLAPPAEGISRLFLFREFQDAGLGLDACGRDFRLKNGIMEARAPLALRSVDGGSEEEWQLFDPSGTNSPTGAHGAALRIRAFVDHTLAGETERTRQFQEYMESVRGRDREGALTKDTARALALEDLSAWLRRAGWGTAQFELWYDADDGRFESNFFTSGAEGEFPTLEGPDGEEDFVSYFQRFSDVFSTSETYTFDGEHLVEGFHDLPETSRT